MWLACSGPRVAEMIAAVNQNAQWAALGAVPFNLILLFAKSESRLFNICRIAAVAPFCLHPSWTLSASGGDCGSTKQTNVIWVSIFILETGLVGLVKVLNPPKKA